MSVQERLRTPDSVNEQPDSIHSSRFLDFCVELAKKRKMTLEDVLVRVMWAGEKIVKIADEDGDPVVIRKSKGGTIALKIFGDHKNGNTNNSSG